MTQILNPQADNPQITTSKAGAVFRLVLSAVITFVVALQGVHTLGLPIGPWAIVGAGVLALKDVQSYMSQRWTSAFGTPAPNVPAQTVTDGAGTSAPALPPAAPTVAVQGDGATVAPDAPPDPSQGVEGD